MELTLDEFEMLSLDRLQLLRGIEILKAKGDEQSFNAKVNDVSCVYISMCRSKVCPVGKKVLDEEGWIPTE